MTRASSVEEFYYKLPGALGGNRPGAHRSRSLGPGLSFATHRRLFDQPDPRRLDLRASLRDVRGEWLVRANRQHSSVTVNAIVDVSESMFFGSEHSKLSVVGNFVEALGYSAFRHGDSVSLLAFDHTFREDLYVAPRASRGIGITMANVLASCNEPAPGRPIGQSRNQQNLNGLLECASRVSNRAGLVFLLSDFHWPLESLTTVLDQFIHSLVVPIVVWDPAETEAPASGGWLTVSDSESGHRRNLWVRESTRKRWIDSVAQRKEDIQSAFRTRDIHPLFLNGHFDAEQLTRHFMEKVL